jgi:hypothetical protein
VTIFAATSSGYPRSRSRETGPRGVQTTPPSLVF